jgi:hypothetical protein
MSESTVKDNITGFEGVVTGTRGTNGKYSFEITRFDDNGKKETKWVNEINLEVKQKSEGK